MAVTAFPVILVNGASGDDAAASGAGPATALTGAAGVTSADGLTVVLDGSPDLTDVATDGSHVIFMSDASAGERNFCAINGKGDSGMVTAYVTVEQAFQALNTDAWAIGGLRDTIGSTTSAKLFDNNGASGDAMPGWAVEMQSGHTETITATYSLRRIGDSTSGQIELRGEAGAATKPVVTFSNNGVGISCLNSYIWVHDFELRNSHGTKNASVGWQAGAFLGQIFSGMTMTAATENNFWKGILTSTGNSEFRAYGNDIRNTTSHAIEINSTGGTGDTVQIFNNYIRDAGSDGIRVTAAINGLVILKNIIYSCTGDGIGIPALGFPPNTVIVGNTIDSNSDGISVAADPDSQKMLLAINNIISNNTAYGINFNSATEITLISRGVLLLNNAFYNNTSGSTDVTGYTGTGATTGVDPSYTNAGSNDFSIGSALASKGYPLGGTATVGGGSATYSYVDPGAAQRVPSGGSGGVIGGPSKRAGMQ